MPARRERRFIADPESMKRVVALLLAPVVFQLALVLVPPRSAPRLSPAYRRRVRNARWAARITQPERPRALPRQVRDRPKNPRYSSNSRSSPGALTSRGSPVRSRHRPLVPFGSWAVFFAPPIAYIPGARIRLQQALDLRRQALRGRSHDHRTRQRHRDRVRDLRRAGGTPTLPHHGPGGA